MKLTVNGKALECDPPVTGGDLLDRLGVARGTAVAELNGSIIPREQFIGHQLADGDSLELVTVVGGG